MSRILLVHGWGFGPNLWRPLRAALPAHAWFALDLGYFGPAELDLPPALELVVGHSFGCLWAMGHPGLAGLPLVAVNGFPRFSAAPDFPHGTPLRVLDRMLRRLREDPGDVLRSFHTRCGTAMPRGGPDRARLTLDLLRMRDEDARPFPARQPILALAAEDDPLVAPTLARQAFPGGLRLLPGGGHVLPLTRPAALAQIIQEGLGG
jgi:pimeloyl-ACP methyl ester carboxylesterase